MPVTKTGSRWVGGHLVFHDKANEKSIIDIIGADAVKFVEDFVGTDAASDALPGWTTTLVEAGGGESTVTIANNAAGELLLTTDANEDDGINLQLDGEAFEMTSGQSLVYFGIRLKVSEATQSDILVGLCITDSTLLGGMTDGVYFECLDGATDISAVSEKDSTEEQTDTVGTLATAFITLEFLYDGSTIEFFIDGASVATHETEIPTEPLTPSIHFLTGAGSVETANIDWIRAFMIGR